MPEWTGRLVLTLVVAGLVVLVVLGVGHYLGEGLRDDARYQANFADIECPPPPGMAREEFLSEVQYQGGFPDHLAVLDKEQTRKLALAFAAHAWVEKVEGVRVQPPNKIRIHLTYRTPVLAVEARGKPDRSPVDRFGVVLPTKGLDPSLPLLKDIETVGATPTGAVWNDPAVQAAAKVAGHLSGDLGRLGLTEVRVEDEDVVLQGDRSRVVWGRPPGQEQEGEPSAEAKKAHLREEAEKAGDAGLRLDLRQPAPSGDQ